VLVELVLHRAEAMPPDVVRDTATEEEDEDEEEDPALHSLPASLWMRSRMRLRWIPLVTLSSVDRSSSEMASSSAPVMSFATKTSAYCGKPTASRSHAATSLAFQDATTC
jgi:hypothetical protein